MNYFKDNSNKPYLYEKGVLNKEDWISNIEEKLNITLTEIEKTEFDSIVEALNNPQKTPEQIRQEKLALLNSAWDNIKIAYDTVNQVCYQIKYGKEINETLESESLYNVDDLSNVTLVDENCHLYKTDRETINILTSKITAKYEPLENENWYGSLGTYPLNMLEIGVVLEKANKIIQQLADEILGA